MIGVTHKQSSVWPFDHVGSRGLNSRGLSCSVRPATPFTCCMAWLTILTIDFIPSAAVRLHGYTGFRAGFPLCGCAATPEAARPEADQSRTCRIIPPGSRRYPRREPFCWSWLLKPKEKEKSCFGLFPSPRLVVGCDRDGFGINSKVKRILSQIISIIAARQSNAMGPSRNRARIVIPLQRGLYRQQTARL